MSCKQKLLLDAVLRRLNSAPAARLGDLTREFNVSRRTLQNAVNMTIAKTFREVREQILVKRVKTLLDSQPTRGIKELSFELGYKSGRSFARAIKRVCGFSPAQLRSRIILQLFKTTS